MIKGPKNNDGLCPFERFIKRYWLGIIVFFGGVIGISFFLFYPFGDLLDDVNKAEKVGCFMSGFAGTIIGLGGVVMLIITLRQQIQKDKDEGFERRFFQMLDYHRQITSEIEVGQRTGIRTFVKFMDEFKLALEIVEIASIALQKELTDLERINLAYLAFYYGSGEYSNPILRSYLDDYDNNFIDYFLRNINDETRKIFQESHFAYKPLEGHQSRLGHYFRHLYQIVCYIDEHAEDLEQGREFAGILRAQLSNHEQALLFLNSLSTLGKPWRTKEFMEKYDMIKNIPPRFFDPKLGIDPVSFYPEVDFEYKQNSAKENEPNRDRY